MLAVRGNIQGNTVILEDEDIKKFDSKDVIVTILDYPYKRLERQKVNFEKFVKPTNRGIEADDYIKELRSDDRL